MQPLAQIHFMPLDRTASVPNGSSLLDALRQAEIPIEIICGGKGLCRKCRVILSGGNCRTVIQPGGSRPTPEEEEQGIRFACQVVVTGDCEFQIPPESRRESPQILLASFSRAAEVCPSVARYPVERISPDGLPFAGGSIRLLGYSGVRPQMSDRIYDAILHTDSPTGRNRLPSQSASGDHLPSSGRGNPPAVRCGDRPRHNHGCRVSR